MVHLADCLSVRDIVCAVQMLRSGCVTVLSHSSASDNPIFTAQSFRCIIEKT